MKDKNLYVKAYFFIEAEYIWGKGMDKEKIGKFEAEIKELLSSIGFDRWNKSSPSSSITGHRGRESLYCHPQDLVGYVIKDKVKEIEAVIKEGKTFSFRKTDTRDEAYNYTGEEFKGELQEHREEIEAKLLEHFTTKRKNLYRDSRVLRDLDTGIKYFKDDLPLKDMERRFILEIFESLVKQGKLVEGVNKFKEKIYRTTGKVAKEIDSFDQKEAKL